MLISLISILLLAIVPFCHIYFWCVVWSLRKRLTMEIAIGYNENANVMSREEAQEKMAMAVLAQQRLRQQFQVT